MLQPECPYCKHVNPSASKFCNACGAPLYLLPCPDCGAVNDAAAKACHQCGAALPGSGSARPRGTAGVAAPTAAAPDDASDADLMELVQDLHDRLARIEAEHSGPGPEDSPAERVSDREPGHATATGATPAVGVPRSRRFALPREAWFFVGGIALLAGTVGGYYAFGRNPTAHLSHAPAAVENVTEDKAPVPASGAPPASSEAAPYPSLAGPLSAAAPGAPRAATPASPASSVLPTEPPGLARASAPPLGQERASAPPRQAESSLGITPPPPARLGPCTEAIASLGLCVLEPTQRKE